MSSSNSPHVRQSVVVGSGVGGNRGTTVMVSPSGCVGCVGGTVTPPTAKAAGFLRRCLSSAGEGQPGPGCDVDCRVDVGVRCVPAASADELGLTNAVLLGDVPAFGTRAGGVAGVYPDHVATGAFSLVCQDSEELPPTRVED